MLMYLVSDNHCQQLGNPGEEQISVQSFMDNNASERAIRGFCERRTGRSLTQSMGQKVLQSSTVLQKQQKQTI